MANIADKLLPHEAYSGVSQNQVAANDKKLKEDFHKVPINPGVYKDKTGDFWTLKENGFWEDKDGEVRTSQWTPLLSLFGPWTP